MSRQTADLMEAASVEYDEGNVDRASYLLLVALVAAVDQDVNVSDVAQTALAKHRLSSLYYRRSVTPSSYRLT